MSLLSLPRELLTLIAYNLPYEDVMSYRSINKFFHSLIDERFWEHKYDQDLNTRYFNMFSSKQRYYAITRFLDPYLIKAEKELDCLYEEIYQALDEDRDVLYNDFYFQFIEVDGGPISLVNDRQSLRPEITVILVRCPYDGQQCCIINQQLDVRVVPTCAYTDNMSSGGNYLRYICPSSFTELLEYLYEAHAWHYAPISYGLDFEKLSKRFPEYFTIVD